jgi:hypothetical protein
MILPFSAPDELKKSSRRQSVLKPTFIGSMAWQKATF